MQETNHTPLLHLQFSRVLCLKMLSITMALSLNMDKHVWVIEDKNINLINSRQFWRKANLNPIMKD